ncbi:hypothetical protein DERF_002418 [Dermatophagoides farinae]|uniref:Cleavage stimulation factor subunit 1-like protein n=1 Tax=Dermatophagoides farinae TaxID=6954 RepID=A0A922IAM3_DERFA|nr:uncharacterized protein LOC124498248 isoform X1 [Dermatophagoides farinae]KAH7636391.1 cleavage stimulation factor subunit 1-like protein [Dermatophagoides farinae]KAH9528472.1 hypothetical protein DERF_002418 [Dermatophagoides farinae]
MKASLFIGFLLVAIMVIVAKAQVIDDDEQFDISRKDGEKFDKKNPKLQGFSFASIRKNIKFLVIGRYGYFEKAKEFLRCLNLKILESCSAQIIECLKTENPKICMASLFCGGEQIRECLHHLPNEPLVN